MSDSLDSQPSESATLANIDRCAALGHRISDVGFVCAEEQVVDVAALSIVASMKDMQPARDSAVDQLPRKAMGANALALP
jgi:hypothetical protein